MDIDHNLVKGCPLCGIFLEPDKNLKTKLYYPEQDKINKVDFIIIDCSTCRIPMVIMRDHTTNISKEQWGRILYQCRKMFGNVQLRCKPQKIHDHYHCHIIKNLRE